MTTKSLLHSSLEDNIYYNSMLAGNAAYEPFSNTYQLIETQIMTGSSTSSIVFSNLNSTYGSTYEHLQIRATHRNTVNDTAIWLGLRFNSDTGSTYSRHDVYATGSGVGSSGGGSQGYIILGESVSSQIVANSFAGTIADILDRFNASKFTTVKSISGQTGARNRLWRTSGSWGNVAAITSVELYLPQGGNFLQGSRFSLYGLRSA